MTKPQPTEVFHFIDQYGKRFRIVDVVGKYKVGNYTPTGARCTSITPDETPYDEAPPASSGRSAVHDKMWKRAASLRQALDLLGVHHLPKADQEFLEELCNPYVENAAPSREQGEPVAPVIEGVQVVNGDWATADRICWQRMCAWLLTSKVVADSNFWTFIQKFADGELVAAPRPEDGESDRECIVADSNYMAGMTLGWNCAITGDKERYDAAIENRLRERAALRSAPKGAGTDEGEAK